MATSEQLEHDVDKTRGRMEETLAELRERLSPPSLIDEALGYAKENGGADFVRNLGRQIADNPLPVALMGAGLAWLMVAQNRSANDAGSERAGRVNRPVKRTEAMSNYESDRRPEMGDSQDMTGMTEKAKDMYGRAAETMGDVRERASDLVGRARETTSGAYQKVSESMSSAMETVSSSMPSTRGIANFMQDEPMVLAGLGIALGAIIGALVPTTEIEERYVGPTAEALKEQAKSAAREQWERGKEMAAEGWDEAKEAARRTWDDAKQEAQEGWDNTQQRMALDGAGDMTRVRVPLAPSSPETEHLADAHMADGRYRG